MNSFERYQNALAGLPVDKIPNFDIIMGFGAQFIGQKLRAYYLDHRVLVESNLAMVDHFGLDILQAISDSYREAHDFGLEVDFPEDGMPVVKRPLLVDEMRIRQLKPLDPGTGKRMSDRLEAVWMFAQQAKGSLPIMGWVEGALAELADIRGVSQTLLDLVDRPGWLEEALDVITQTEIAFGIAQVRAGADIIGMGDSLASQISPRMYREFALPYEKRIIEAIHQAGAKVRLHICGNTTRIFPDMTTSGADILDVDHMVDLAGARQVAQERAGLLGIQEPALTGNFDPVSVMLQGSEEQVASSVEACILQGGPRYMSAAGCEIPPGTPPGNLLAQDQVLWDTAKRLLR